MFGKSEISASNWAAVYHICNRYGAREWRTLPEWKRHVKEAFNAQAVRPLDSYADELNPINRLLLLNEIDETVLDELRSFTPKKYKQNTPHLTEELASRVLGISANEHFTFGHNTFFGGKEKDIVEALGFYSSARLDLITQSVSERCRNNHDVSQIVSLPVALREYLHKVVPADSNLAWMDFDTWESKIRGCPQSANFKQYNSFAPDAGLLSAAWAFRNPSLVDTRIYNLAKNIEELLTDESVSRRIREHYQEQIDRAYNKYVSENHLGEKVTVCVRYDSEVQLQSMAALLDPKTRYPLVSGQSKRSINYIPILHEHDIRTSHHILLSMWGRGIAFNNVDIIDSQTILCEPRVGAVLPIQGCDPLCLDASNIATKVEAKKAVKGDGDPGYKKRFPHVVVIGDKPETWYAAFSNTNIRIHVMSLKKMREFTSECRNTKELALRLASAEGNKLMKNELKNAASRAVRNKQKPLSIIR